MPYTAEISRANPTCFLFLVDQSSSMAHSFGGESGKPKAQGVADALNRLLQTMVFRCAKGDYILDRYFIGVVGYGAEMSLGFRGELAGGVLRPVSEIGNTPLRIEERTRKVEDGAGGLVDQVTKFPVWFEPVAAGRTPMCHALQTAQEVLGDFIGRFPDCFPPVTINVTDGAATDGDPEPAAAALRNFTSSDGNVLLFNLHISGTGQTPAVFPSNEDSLADPYARRLFRMSSPLPPEMIEQAEVLGYSVAEGARGFAYNADLVSVITFLDIGTRASLG